MHTTTIAIWVSALLVYGVFWLWYVGLGRPLTAAEIDAHLATVAAAKLPIGPGQLETLRAFLESDDGGEFFMLNLLRFKEGLVTVPGAAAPQKSREVMEGYRNHFMPALLRRAGHPAYFGRAAGGYVEQWDVEPNPGWTAAAAIRYRSRRDMIELVVDPRFADAHAFKQAALANTLAFPTSPGYVVVGPKIWVGLALGLFAALLQIGVGTLRG